jgi:hypothetical protein
MANKTGKRRAKTLAKKGKGTGKPVGGPFLAAAMFCESTMEDKDGVLSAIRIVDTVNLWLAPNAPPSLPSNDEPIGTSQNALVTFRTGDSPGTHSVGFVINSPSGEKGVSHAKDFELGKEPNSGVNIRTAVPIKITGSGVYWIDVILDGKRVTRMPLNVRVHRTDDKDKKKK